MSSGDDVDSGRVVDTGSGVLWSTIAFAGTKVLSLASTAVLARLLTPDEFGVVAAILVFIGFIELGGDLGMRSTVVYEQERGITARVQTAFTVNVVLVLLLTALGIVLAEPAAAFFGLGGDVDLFRLACLSMPLRAFGNIADSLLLRELAFKKRFVPELTNSIVKAAVSVALAVAGMDAAAMIIGVLAGNFAWSAVQWNLTGFRPVFSFDRAIARSMVAYGGTAATLEVVSLVANRLDSVVIGRALGAQALGVYSVAMRIPELAIDSVSWTVSRVAFPALSRSRAAENDINGAALGLVRFQSLYAVPVAVGAGVLAEPLLVVLFGSQWRAGAGVLAALATMTAARAMSFPVGDMFKALGRQGVLVWANLVQIPLFLVAVIAVANEGITAVAWVRSAVTVAGTVVIFVLGRRIVGVSLSGVARALVPSLVTGTGVLVGAGAVSLGLQDATDLVLLLAGTGAGFAGGVVALALFARPTFDDVWEALSPARRRDAARAEAGTRF